MKTIILLLLTVLIVSCSKKNELPGLFIKTSDVKGVDENQVRKDTITKFALDYLEVGLNSYDGGFFKAKKDLVKPESLGDFKMKFYFIADSLGKEIEFENSTEFLNFMSARGYEMADQVKHQYRIDYTFKRRTEVP